MRQILHGGSSASWAGNLTFWGTLLPQKPEIQYICGYAIRVGASEQAWPVRLPKRLARWPRVGSACVNIRPSPKTDVLVYYTYLFLTTAFTVLSLALTFSPLAKRVMPAFTSHSPLTGTNKILLVPAKVYPAVR